MITKLFKFALYLIFLVTLLSLFTPRSLADVTCPATQGCNSSNCTCPGGTTSGACICGSFTCTRTCTNPATPTPTPSYTCTKTAGQVCIASQAGSCAHNGLETGSGTCPNSATCCGGALPAPTSTPTPTPVPTCPSDYSCNTGSNGCPPGYSSYGGYGACSGGYCCKYTAPTPTPYPDCQRDLGGSCSSNTCDYGQIYNFSGCPSSWNCCAPAPTPVPQNNVLDFMFSKNTGTQWQVIGTYKTHDFPPQTYNINLWTNNYYANFPTVGNIWAAVWQYPDHTYTPVDGGDTVAWQTACVDPHQLISGFLAKLPGALAANGLGYGGYDNNYVFSTEVTCPEGQDFATYDGVTWPVSCNNPDGWGAVAYGWCPSGPWCMYQGTTHSTSSGRVPTSGDLGPGYCANAFAQGQTNGSAPHSCNNVSSCIASYCTTPSAPICSNLVSDQPRRHILRCVLHVHSDRCELERLEYVYSTIGYMRNWVPIQNLCRNCFLQRN